MLGFFSIFTDNTQRKLDILVFCKLVMSAVTLLPVLFGPRTFGRAKNCCLVFPYLFLGMPVFVVNKTGYSYVSVPL